MSFACVDLRQEKLALIRSLYRRGYQRTEILELFRFIDWVLVLPEGLEAQLWTEVQQFAEEKRMRYVSSFERIAQKRGIEQGIEKGVGKGQARLLKLLIQQRFVDVPAEVDVRLQAATPEQLEAWALRVLSAPTLEAVFEVDGVH